MVGKIGHFCKELVGKNKVVKIKNEFKIVMVCTCNCTVNEVAVHENRNLNFAHFHNSVELKPSCSSWIKFKTWNYFEVKIANHVIYYNIILVSFNLNSFLSIWTLCDEYDQLKIMILRGRLRYLTWDSFIERCACTTKMNFHNSTELLYLINA